MIALLLSRSHQAHTELHRSLHQQRLAAAQQPEGSEGLSQPRNNSLGGTLIVCPPPLIQQWVQEIKRHSNLSVMVYEGVKWHMDDAAKQLRQQERQEGRGRKKVGLDKLVIGKQLQSCSCQCGRHFRCQDCNSVATRRCNHGPITWPGL